MTKEIKPNELRIGNLIKKDKIVVTVDGRTIFDFWSYNNNNRNHEPIELNEDWLHKFDFDKNPKAEIWEIENHRYYFELFYHDGIYHLKSTGSPVGYVHELQNLYFAITGKELTPQ